MRRVRARSCVWLKDRSSTNVSWTLARAGVIAGTVFDEFGDPAFNVPVRAVRFIYTNGFQQLMNAGTATTTDDRGMYRVAGLMPGEYLVSAVPRDTVTSLAAQAEANPRSHRADQRGGHRQLAACRTGPRAASAKSGRIRRDLLSGHAELARWPQRVAVGPSQEVHGIDIRLHSIRTVTIAGAITSSEAMPQTRLQLIDASMPMSGHRYLVPRLPRPTARSRFPASCRGCTS